jgi:hypothetical protein
MMTSACYVHSAQLPRIGLASMRSFPKADRTITRINGAPEEKFTRCEENKAKHKVKHKQSNNQTRTNKETPKKESKQTKQTHKSISHLRNSFPRRSTSGRTHQHVDHADGVGNLRLRLPRRNQSVATTSTLPREQSTWLLLTSLTVSGVAMVRACCEQMATSLAMIWLTRRRVGSNGAGERYILELLHDAGGRSILELLHD